MGQGDHASENIGREYLDDNERHLFQLYFNTCSGKSQVTFLLYLEVYLIFRTATQGHRQLCPAGSGQEVGGCLVNDSLAFPAFSA